MSRDRDISRFAAQTIANPLRRIVRLQIAGRREFRERVARAPDRFRRLLRAQLAAVPHDRRPGVIRGGASGDALDACDPSRRQRPARVDLGADRFPVMSQEQMHSLLVL
jgi:hypothetical protein